MTSITLCKSIKQVPETLPNNGILMNGSGEDIKLNAVSPSIDPNPRTLNVTENDTYTVDAADKGFDAMKTVEVKVNVKSEAYFDTFEGIQQVSFIYVDGEDLLQLEKNALSQLRDFAEHCNCVGALLSIRMVKGKEPKEEGGKKAPSKKSVTYIYTIWNGDPNNPDYYWDPLSTDEVWPDDYFGYGNAKAVCAGPGLWVTNDNYKLSGSWAESGTNLYNYFIGPAVKGTGWENTCCIFENFSNNVFGRNNIWSKLAVDNIVGIPNWGLDKGSDELIYGNVYIPSISEQRTIQQNCVNVSSEIYDDPAYYYAYNTNLNKFLGYGENDYWSSSQYQDDREGAYRLRSNGNVSNYNKDTSYLFLVAVKF